jgi:DNA-binding NtrC family response regulator
MNRKNILILDPERDICELCARALETQRDCKCYVASREEDAISLLGDISFDLLLVDMSMAMTDDFALLKKIKRSFPRVAVIVAVYLHQKGSIAGAVSVGAAGHLVKPIKVDSFRRRIAEFLSPDRAE